MNVKILLTLIFLALFSTAGCKKYKSSGFKLIKRFSPKALGFKKNTQCSDGWGYKDERTGYLYAIITCDVGSAIVDVQSMTVLGVLKSQHSNIWRDVKIYKHYAFFVSEEYNSMLTILDLNHLIDTGNMKTHKYNNGLNQWGSGNFASAHNIAIDEVKGLAFLMGGQNKCKGGMHIVNIKNPLKPRFVSCFADTYVHDSQCVTYNSGKSICFAFAPAKGVLAIDVTNPKKPKLLSELAYDNLSYAHQGYLTSDKKYLLVDDEDDKTLNGYRTFVIDVRNLKKMKLKYTYTAKGTRVQDHNQYATSINGSDYTFQANYANGLAVLKVNEDSLAKVAYFDSYKKDNKMHFKGAWSVYPFFFPIVFLSDSSGLFILNSTFA